VDTDVVFVSKRNGEALMPSGVYQVLKRLAKRTGVTGRFNPHAFRHNRAREAMNNGATLADVEQILGHSDGATTMRFYSRWDDHELKKRHSQFSPLADGR
jgi:integrase/recombinase XerD